MRKMLRRGMLWHPSRVVRSMMRMSEESSSPRIAPISEPPGADKESSEIASLRMSLPTPQQAADRGEVERVPENPVHEG